MHKIRFSKKTLANTFSMVVFVGLLIGFGVYVSKNWDRFSAIKNISVYHLVVLVSASLIYFVSQGLILRAVVRPFGIRLGCYEWFGIVMTTLLGNFFFPFGGLGIRAAYLKRRHRLAYSDFASTFGAIYLIELFVFTIGGMLALSLIWTARGVVDPILVVLFTGVLLACLVVFLVPFERFHLRHRSLRSVMTVAKSWAKLRQEPRLWRRLLVFTVLEFLAVASTFFVAYLAIGKSVPFVEAFVPACLSDYAMIVRILPASFGVYEFSAVYASRLVGCNIAESVLVVSLVRACSLGLILLMGPLFARSLMSRCRKSETEPVEWSHESIAA